MVWPEVKSDKKMQFKKPPRFGSCVCYKYKAKKENILRILQKQGQAGICRRGVRSNARPERDKMAGLGLWRIKPWCNVDVRPV